MVIEQGISPLQAEEQKPKPLNPLGEWLDAIRQPRGLALEQTAALFELPGLNSIRRKPTWKISLYTIQKVLEGAQKLGCTEDEMASLRDTVTTVIQETLELKGKLYTRIPPTVPSTIARDLPCTVFTDTQFVRSLSPQIDEVELQRQASRIQKARTSLGLPPIFTKDQAVQITDTIKQRQEKQDKKEAWISPFARSLIDDLNVNLNTFKARYNNWIRQVNGFPNPKQFGFLLQNIRVSEETREQVITLWLDGFRERIGIMGATFSNEMSFSKKMLGLMAHKINPDYKLSNWETIEKIREHYQNRPRKTKSK